MREYPNLVLTDEFMLSFASRKFSAADQRAFTKALALLDEGADHPSLRVHKLTGDKAGRWSASATLSLRIEFERVPDGRKKLIKCSHHYDD